MAIYKKGEREREKIAPGAGNINTTSYCWCSKGRGQKKVITVCNFSHTFIHYCTSKTLQIKSQTLKYKF